MRYFLVTLVLLAYPGLLVAVYWCPSSGPREVYELSVAKDGSFTTSSLYSDTATQGAIDYWAPDLTHRKKINLAGYLVGWAHALSPDGDTVATITTDGRSPIIEVVSVADDTHEVAIDAPTSGSAFRPSGWANRLYFCGSKESTFLIADGDNAFVCSQDDKQNQQFQAEGAWPLSSFGSQYFAISNNLADVTDPSGKVHYDREYRFYDAEATPLRLIYRKQRPSEDWQGVAIGSDGTIVVQHPGHIQFRDADGSQRKIEWPMERGFLWRIDPTSSYLLFTTWERSRTVMIVDAGTGKVLSSRETDSDLSLSRCEFQDSSHLLIAERGGDSVSGRVVRWNWREDTAIAKSVGGTTAQTLSRRLKWLGVAFLLWFLVATWVARTSHEKFTPTAVVAAVAVIGCVWAYHHPRFEEHYLEWEIANPSWAVLTAIWLVVPVLVCLAVCKAPDKLARRLPILVVVSALSADRLHHLLPTGSWFFPLILLFVLIWLVGVSIIIHYGKYRRKKSRQIDGAVSASSQSASFRLIDLLLLIAAIAIALAVLSNFDGFDQNLSSITWALVCSIPLAVLAALGGLSSLSNASWWKRYLPLVGLTFLIPLGFSFGASVLRFWSIEGGDEFPFFLTSDFTGVMWLFTVFLVYAVWLYRGTMIASHADAVTESRSG